MFTSLFCLSSLCFAAADASSRRTGTGIAGSACNLAEASVDQSEGLHLIQRKGVKAEAVAGAVEKVPHESGHRAALNEEGYQAVAKLKDDGEMEAFIRRAAVHLGLQIHDRDGVLRGVVPYYSGTKAVQDFENLLLELERTAHRGDENNWISTVSLMQFKKRKTEAASDAESDVPHESGHRAAMSDRGYQAVVKLKDDAEMEAYIHRAARHLGLEVHDKWGFLKGIVPWYSGTKTSQNWEKLLLELENAAHRGGAKDRWISPMSYPA